ncbi:hypothetical protein ABTL50_19390, partial [Acinetobacter baumannii]
RLTQINRMRGLQADTCDLSSRSVIMEAVPQKQTPPPAGLRRRIGLPLLGLYGTGVTVGAGIYVLIGAVAGHAGTYAPWAFALAAVVMAFT